jgi:nucleoside-diphosphate-sugar epimerase
MTPAGTPTAGILVPNAMAEVHRAVVTGVAGFIGSHLAEALIDRGVAVTGIDVADRSGSVRTDHLQALLRHPRFTLVRADLRVDDLAPFLEGDPVVFHLAALAGVRSSWGEQFQTYLDVNVIGTQRLLDACAEAEIARLVIASSSSVYGPHRGTPFMEEDQPWPASPYGVSKLAAERLAMAYANRPGSCTSVVALRYFSVYGPRQRSDMWICRALHAALTGHTVNLYGDGCQRRDFTYIGDVVTATLAAAVVPARSEVVNVGTGTATSMLDVLDLVTEVTGLSVPLSRLQTSAGDVPVTEADLTRARQILGYVPQTDLRAGIERQWVWMTEKPYSTDIYKSTLSSGVI